MSISEQLKGTSWALVEYKSESKDGDVLYPLGEDALGTIIFTEEGHTAVQIMANDRTQVLSQEALAKYNTEVEKKMGQLGYHAYTGPFTIDEEESILTTHVELSLIPDYVGSKQARKASLDGDTLKLSNVQHPERKLVWKRIKEDK